MKLKKGTLKRNIILNKNHNLLKGDGVSSILAFNWLISRGGGLNLKPI
jgi:hypothetical protein